MTGLRVTLAAFGAAAAVAAALIGRPQVFAPLAVLGIAAFVVAAGCLAADLLPLRRGHALCSALSLADAILLALGGQLSRLPALAPALVLVLLQAAPALTTRGARHRAS
ncbi:MAG TPA: hypothetical protein VGI72_04210 [Gaiellales bacterium]